MVSDSTQRGTHVECDERGQRLLINAAEHGIVLAQQTRGGDGQLYMCIYTFNLK
jgi:hypothetical protein